MSFLVVNVIITFMIITKYITIDVKPYKICIKSYNNLS